MGLTELGAEVLPSVMLNPKAFFCFHWEKIAFGQSFALCISGAVPCTWGDVKGAVRHGYLFSSHPLCSHPGARSAGWPCSIYHCKGLECPVESLGKTLHDCDGHWVGAERDITHQPHPPSQWCRTTSNKKFGGTREGAHADEI